MGKKIRVLIIDDSMVFREVITRGISSDPSIYVVGTANDPFDARDKMLELNPDVITCDIEMPKMNGIEFVRKLMPQYPIPVIVVSSVSNAVFDAMNAGAVDFLTKPQVKSPDAVKNFIEELIEKVKSASNAKVHMEMNKNMNNRVEQIEKNSKYKVIAIGASTGGTESIFKVLKNLPQNIPGIVIVQHIPPLFSKMFAERLNTQTVFRVKEAVTGDVIESGKVLIAPGDQHMTVIKVGEQYKVEVNHGDKVNGHCPSVDVLFDSVAKNCGANAIGIILTGMGYDGAKGILAMRRKGAKTIGQDEESCVVYGMPKVAFEVGGIDKQVSLDLVPGTLCNLLK